MGAVGLFGFKDSMEVGATNFHKSETDRNSHADAKPKNCAHAIVCFDSDDICYDVSKLNDLAIAQCAGLDVSNKRELKEVHSYAANGFYIWKITKLYRFQKPVQMPRHKSAGQIWQHLESTETKALRTAINQSISAVSASAADASTAADPSAASATGAASAPQN